VGRESTRHIRPSAAMIPSLRLREERRSHRGVSLSPPPFHPSYRRRLAPARAPRPPRRAAPPIHPMIQPDPAPFPRRRARVSCGDKDEPAQELVRPAVLPSTLPIPTLRWCCMFSPPQSRRVDVVKKARALFPWLLRLVSAVCMAWHGTTPPRLFSFSLLLPPAFTPFASASASSPR
jgi:hypothetical protein